MPVLVFTALILAIVAGVWAAVNRAWQLLLVSIAVVLLCLAGTVDLNIEGAMR